MRRSACVIGAVLATLVLLLGASYWYMIPVEGRWDGVPLEQSVDVDLSALAEDLLADVAYLADTVGPRNPKHHASLVEAEEWVIDRWQKQGYVVHRQAFVVEGVEVANLEIEFPGRSLPEEIVVLSAQYDTWPDSPGANNNASGMAVLLELSERLRSLECDRTLRLVAFVTQEPPYDNTEAMGSLRYARRSRERGENIRVMIAMDAIGIYTDEPGSQRIPFPFSLFYPDRGNFLGFIADLPSRSLLIETTRGFAKGTAFPIAAASIPRWVKGARWSDHNSFWRMGYRGIQITDTGAFRSPASHTTELDTIEKIDFDALAQVTMGMEGAVRELTTVGGFTP
jgi:hypothetical protein